MCLDKVLPMSVLTEGVGPYGIISPQGVILPPTFGDRGVVEIRSDAWGCRGDLRSPRQISFLAQAFFSLFPEKGGHGRARTGIRQRKRDLFAPGCVENARNTQSIPALFALPDTKI